MNSSKEITVIKRSISKELLKDFPIEAFNGKIVIVEDVPSAERAVLYLRKCSYIGLDTETKPIFKKGARNKVALLQLGNNEICFLFRLNSIGLLPCIIDLLEDPKVIKIGLSLKDDFAVLKKRASFEPKNFIELQEFVRPFGILDKSLQKIFAILFQEKISKSQRMSNWNAEQLTEAQQKYAATDAWACVRIYERLEGLRNSGNFIIEPLQTEEEQTEISQYNKET